MNRLSVNLEIVKGINQLVIENQELRFGQIINMLLSNNIKDNLYYSKEQDWLDIISRKIK